MNLISMTPLMEYMDMLYMRLAIEMPKHKNISSWHVEVHPPRASGQGVGFIKLKAMRESGKRSLSVSYTASMDAIEHGARVSTTALEIVVDHHIRKFVEKINDDS